MTQPASNKAAVRAVKRKIIIHIEDDSFSDLTAVRMVERVIQGGRISTTAGREHYCHVTTFGPAGAQYVHATKRTDSTDTFYIR